jgi:hypothetical protein
MWSNGRLTDGGWLCAISGLVGVVLLGLAWWG